MRSEKLQLVKDIGNMLTGSSFMFFISYKGLKVKDLTELRTSLAKQKAECHILKNRLVKKAAELSGISKLTEISLKEDTALILGSGDPGAVAKIVDTFFKARQDQPGSKGGFFEGALLSKKDVEDIASLPSKEVLYAQLLGVMQAPSRNLVSVLNMKASSIVNVLNAYKEKLEKETK